MSTATNHFFLLTFQKRSCFKIYSKTMSGFEKIINWDENCHPVVGLMQRVFSLASIAILGKNLYIQIENLNWFTIYFTKFLGKTSFESHGLSEILWYVTFHETPKVLACIITLRESSKRYISVPFEWYKIQKVQKEMSYVPSEYKINKIHKLTKLSNYKCSWRIEQSYNRQISAP